MKLTSRLNSPDTDRMKLYKLGRARAEIVFLEAKLRISDHQNQVLQRMIDTFYKDAAGTQAELCNEAWQFERWANQDELVQEHSQWPF